MAWIQSHQELGRHPKTKRAARLLGASLPTVLGHLHLLWHWCLDFAQDGDLTAFEDAEVAEAALWEGDPAALLSALCEAGFLVQDEGRLRVHDWHDYGGKLLEERRADAERKRAARAGQKPSAASPAKNVSGGRPPDRRRTSGVREEKE